MNFIYKDLIKQNIQNLTDSHIKLFALKNKVILTDEEAKIIHKFINENYQTIIEKDTSSFETLKKIVSPTIYNKAISLYNVYEQYL